MARSKKDYFIFTLIDRFFYFFFAVPTDLLSRSLRKNNSGPLTLIKLTEQGTIALISPLLKDLSKTQELIVLTTDQTKEIFESFDFINKTNIYVLKTDSILSFLKSAIICLNEIRSKNPATVINLQFFSFISLSLSFLISPSYIARFGLSKIASGPRLKKIIYRKDAHIFQLHKELFEKAIGKTLDINETYPHQRSSIKTISLFPNHSDHLRQRTWSLSKWLKLINHLQDNFPEHKIQIIGERKDHKVIVEAIKSQKIDFKGKLIFSSRTVQELIENLRTTDLFISSDCGPAHFARIAGAITLTLFGPESPEVFGGNNSDSFYLYKDVPCSPCFNQINGCLSFCSDNKCIESITVEETIEEIEKIIGKYHDP